LGYSRRNPFGVFNEMSLNFNQWLDFDYGGENLYQAVNCNTNAALRNNWRYSASISRENERISNYELRGGPSIRMPGNVNANADLNTDERHVLSAGPERRPVGPTTTRAGRTRFRQRSPGDPPTRSGS